MNMLLWAGGDRDVCKTPRAHGDCYAHVFILEFGSGDGSMVSMLTPLQKVDKTQ